MINYVSKFLYILSGERRKLLVLTILFLFTSVLEAFVISLVGTFITLATNLNNIHSFTWAAALYKQFHFSSEREFVFGFGAAVVFLLWSKSILSFFTQKQIFGFGFGQQAKLRQRLMQAYLRVQYTFHLSRNTASLIQNILNETLAFANGILMPILFAGANLMVVASLVILLFRTDFIATATISIVILSMFGLIYQFRNKISTWGRKASEANKSIVRIINHSIGGFKEVRVIGCEPYFEAQMQEQALIYQDVSEKFHSFSLLPRYILEPLLITFVVLLTVVSIFTSRDLDNLTATLGVFGVAAMRLLPATSNLMQSVNGIRRHTHVIDLLYNDLKELEAVDPGAIGSDPPLLRVRDLALVSPNGKGNGTISFKEQISLDHLVYRYPGAVAPALDGISMTIKKGEAIGLIGKSGAGKTTLVDVILGLLTVESGDIRVDDRSVINNISKWQQLIGYIPQSIFLMDDTLARNVAFGVPDQEIDYQRLDQALEAAQLSEVVAQLPRGLETNVGEKGVMLSGGQRQRVGIARALYHEREILVLDEATAALDNETESLVTNAIKSLSGQKTVIIIAHRLTTIEHCDRVYLIEKGKIARSGSYQSVVFGENPTNPTVH
jgi:ABC-type multidrug transport system fused ATPase/permease subunit